MIITVPCIDIFAIEFYSLLAKEFETQNITLIIATESNYIERYMKAKNVNVINTRKLNGINHSDTWLKFFSNTKPDVVIGSDASESYNLSYVAIAKALKLKVILTCGSSVIANKMYIDNQHIWYLDWVNRDYFNAEPTKEEREVVLNYINNVIKHKPIIGGKAHSIINYERIKRALQYYYISIVKEKCKLSYFNPIISLKQSLPPLVRQFINKQYYSEPDYNEKYVFFPMQTLTDTQLALKCPQFLTQYLPILACAICLPNGYKLYTKEHPHAKGTIPSSWLMVLHKEPNIKIVSPDVNSHDLIKHSQFVITINSDVGYEALLHGKNVVTMADIYYSGFGVTHDVKCFKYSGVSTVEYDKTWSNRIQQIINNATNAKVDNEKIYRLINAILKSVYNCCYYDSNKYHKYTTDAKEIKNIVLAIKQSIGG